jgi:superfamily I DNA/RNA helicase/RecB family exonuclease
VRDGMPSMVQLRRSVPSAGVTPALSSAARAALNCDAALLRVVGGPGTGKTTLAVELVAAAVKAGRWRADECLLLAPTRLGAARLRDAVTTRIGETTTEAMARTNQAFGFAILRAEAALRGEPAPTLLSGPEQDVVLRDLLAGHRAEPERAPAWPESLTAALTTRGFRAELRDLLMRAAEHGVDAAALRGLGLAHDRPEWVAASAVLDEYDQVTALSRPGAYDPAYILTAAADLLEDDPDALRRVREQVRFVVVDDAQELTWAATRLLRVLAHPGMQLVFLTDPDSAVQTFRGADPRLLWSPTWPALSEAPTITLDTAYRLPEALTEVTGRVAQRIGVVGTGAQRGAVSSRAGGEVTVALLRAVTQEGAYLASVLRRAHLGGGMPWRDMAVIVRGGARAGTIRRVLGAAGVPVATSPGAVPVRDEVAVQPLLLLLELSVRMARNLQARPTPEEAVELLTSTVGGADAVSLRRLRRAMRREELDNGGSRTSDELLADALAHPVVAAMTAAATGSDGLPLDRISRALERGVQACRRDLDGCGWARGVTAEAVLWEIWTGLSVARGWRDEALRGGARGVRADRDLDAVLALFAAAGRFADRLPAFGPDGFLDHIRGEEVAGDTLVPRAPSEDVVEVLTPAAAAGREWRLVCVAGVQEGVWPDLRLRGSVLGSSQLVEVLTAGPTSRPSAQAAVRYDETRLFHVAVSRATERLVVTAVRSDDEQPSIYLDLVDPAGVEAGLRAFTEPDRVLSPAAVVGALRREAATEDEVDRRRAARLLVQLAEEGVPGADPTTWWASVGEPEDRPRRSEDRAVEVSPSKVEQFQKCPLRWVLQASGGDGARHPASSIGTLVHDVVAVLGDDSVPALVAEIDRRWPQLGLPPGWVNDRKRREAHDMAGRIVAYADSVRGTWEAVGAEVNVTVRVGRALLRGQVDRLERHTEHRAVRVVDYKTGTTKMAHDEVPLHPQLGAYQVAIVEGGFAEVGSKSAGAALLYVGSSANKKGPDLRVQPALSDQAEPRWAHDLIEASAEGMAAATFSAQPTDQCSRCPVRTSCPAQPDGQAV